MKRQAIAVVAIVVATILASCGGGDTSISWSGPAETTFTLQSNVVYGQGLVEGGEAEKDLLLDLYVPDVESGVASPLIVMIHGGSFIEGFKTDGEVAAPAKAFARQGFIVASIDYRLAGDNPVGTMRIDPFMDVVGGVTAPVELRTGMTAIEDTLTAIEFLQDRDDVDAGRTTLWGSSAGATTALRVG